MRGISNPVLNHKVFAQHTGGQAMTITGTINKTFFFLILVTISAFYVWQLYAAGENIQPYMVIGLLGALILGLVASFKPATVPFTGPLYALLKGMLIGGLSARLEHEFGGIVIQAAAGTIAVFFAMLILYRLRLIKATKRFRSVVLTATAGIFLLYLIHIILRFFDLGVPVIRDATPLGIIFSLFVIVIAALNLIIDFDFIEKGVQRRSSKKMEWYGAFGLTVTLIWLYIEILRLLAKIRRMKN
ncbi:Bax inhibitor-1/YccA family protein [Bacillus sp. FJAT-44742]|uniref:Bax inhibitor-1/YccA family protein n=1 Tax=Bacillus sp. FJAT-44742 TaxID=2014005 RepID=UPI000C242FEC|nr:Bax inhibitor-1/YccA family protein [Bacillus sp. FJAT-44742]